MLQFIITIYAYSNIMSLLTIKLAFIQTLPSIAAGLVPLVDMYNTAVREADSNVMCGYKGNPYDFVCWTTRDVISGEKVRIIIIPLIFHFCTLP